jgi:N-dimethylarginine dimethylaminohydrolase
MPYPESVLMCPPEHFDVLDCKNPYMEDQIGKVDRPVARMQWDRLRLSFERVGVGVELIPPAPACEDMVFSANPVFVGLDPNGRRVCVLSQMKFPSRQKEVSHFAAWFTDRGYQVHDLSSRERCFEGGGDAIWHPGRGLIWGGFGQRTDIEIYSSVAALFGVTVIALELKCPRFYHLDTCFCPIDDRTALVHLPSLTNIGQELVRQVFTNLIEVDEFEATMAMACNAAAFWGTHVVLEQRAKRTIRRLRESGFLVEEVETSEFIKSGGSVFCMKTALF